MATLGVHTLMMAIQAVDNKTKCLAQAIQRADDPELSNLEEEMLFFSKVWMDLKRVYLATQLEFDNLPPDEELIGRLG